ncbi:MAG TPA: glycoside hydrolase family 2 protein [Anaerolineae bacterium]|nr:glycoside hydrolase family 2 protein [Anaerolineae bacterium]
MLDYCKLKDFAPGEGVVLGAYAEKFDTDDWIDVAVPGDVHLTLVAAGRIPDPFYNRNELVCAWVEEREWWYRAQFTYKHGLPQSEERLLLIFHGLDTFVTIWLNGEPLGEHGNMFREVVFDVTHKVRTDRPNTLALCFEAPVDHVRDKPSLFWLPGVLEDTKRNLMRKAQFGFGWDWGPRLPTVGIWRPVELRREHQAAIQGVHFATLEIDPEGERALVSIRVDVERFAGDQPIEVALALIPPNEAEAVAERTIALEEAGARLLAETKMSVKQPSLWWTHDLGEPSLYTLQVRILQDGRELENQRASVGIRTLELDQSLDPDESGARFFRFVLNGVPIFARGANWIPASSFVGALTADRYERLLSAARDANMNMLRVWGGGIYEHDAFYEICDRLGILIWQDFMFACAPYPEDDPNFVDEVRAEARYQVKRLRNHPSLALWCGNNENQWLHQQRALPQEAKKPVPGTLYYDEIIPEAVQELDGFTPYWPGSPYGGPHPNSMMEGDVHDWHVWHGLPVRETDEVDLAKLFTSGPEPEDVSFVHYAENMGRFISEFGMHASPVYETLRRCMPSDQLYHHSPTMDHHNKDNPKNKGDNLMLTVTGLPKDLEEYIDFSMIAQAEGLKFGIEHFRRRKPHCSGTLFWQFNDCWPVLSWSILDYYGFGKAGYFYVKRAYAPVLASFKVLDDRAIELWITNDTLEAVRDTLTIQLGTFAKGKVWEEQHQVQVPANSSQVVWRGEPQTVVAQPEHYLVVRSLADRFPPNRHFFAAVKDLQRPIVEPEVTFSSRGEHELLAHVHAPAYLYYVHVIVPDEYTYFSDNYFDLMAGETRTVVVTNPKVPLTPEIVSVGWR